MPCSKMQKRRIVFTVIAIFSDNCSTRVRDQFENCVNHHLQYDTLNDTKLTYRELIDQYVPGNSWNGLGIKLGLGIPADKTTTYSQKMFLPDYLMNSMASAKLIKDGAVIQFFLPKTILVDAKPIGHGFSLTSPAVIVNLILLIVAVFSFIEFRSKRRIIILDFAVFFSIGIAGLLLSFLCFVSVLEATGWNLNLIWALPTHFIFAFLWLVPSLRPGITWYLKIYSRNCRAFPDHHDFSTSNFPLAGSPDLSDHFIALWY